VHRTAAPFTAAASKLQMLSQNYFPEPNRHTLIFLHPVLLCRINTLSAIGDVLTAYLLLSCSQSAIISNLPWSQQSCMCFVLALQIRLIKLDFDIKILSITLCGVYLQTNVSIKIWLQFGQQGLALFKEGPNFS
jgi:hypothetical protein